MPDLISHIAGAYLVKKGLRVTEYLVLFYLGAILPDLVSRPFHIIMPRTLFAVQAFHSPLGIFLICWLISLCFRIDQRKKVFLLLLSGCFVHLIMDLGQKHLIGGYIWLFPFSMDTYSFGLFWPEDSIKFLPYTIIIILLVYGLEKRKEGRRLNNLKSHTPSTEPDNDQLPIKIHHE